MRDGASLSEAVAEAQALGICEREPGDDLGGKDAAAKLAVLCAVCGQQLDVERIEREGISRSEFIRISSEDEREREYKKYD